MSMLTKITTTEAKLMLRDPGAAFFAVIFPGFLLVALTLVLPGFADPIEEPGLPAELEGLRPVDVYVPIVLALAIATTAFTLVPSYLSTYRERGVLRRLATTPAPPRDLLTAQLAVNLGLLTAGSVLAVVAGVVAFDVDWPGNVPGLLLAFVLATFASFTIGLIIAAVSPNARVAQGIGMVVYFPMLFFAGVWTPGPTMPDTLRTIADFSPIGAASEAMLDAWLGDWPTGLHLAVLAGWAVVASVAATKLFRWE